MKVEEAAIAIVKTGRAKTRNTRSVISAP